MTIPKPLATSASDAYQAFLAVDRFGSLDGLRFLSILAVLWHHSGIRSTFPLLERGQSGVFLFFAISGFLITSLMIRERTKHGQVSLKKFYMRRSLRIFPLYYAVLLAYAVIVFVMERHKPDGQEFFANLPAFATYTTNWFVPLTHGERVIFYFSWSLAVEEQFYLTWPWVERYVTPQVKMLLLGLIVAIVFGNHIGLFLSFIPADSLGYRMLWTIAPCILFGVAAAHMTHNPRGFAAVWRVVGNRWAPLATLAAVTGVMCIPPSGIYHEYAIYFLLALLVVSCTIREDHVLAPVLKFKPFVRIGMISYGIYLMHMLCFNAVNRLGGKLGVTDKFVLWIGGMILVYIIAEISFNTFERFFQKRKKKYSRHAPESVRIEPSAAAA